MNRMEKNGIKALWSAKMRASVWTGNNFRNEKSRKEWHISGAEGLYQRNEIPGIVRKYICRAMEHPRGVPDEIVITVERLEQRPLPISLLPVVTVQCRSPEEAHAIVSSLLLLCSVSRRAIARGYRIAAGSRPMRGAALVRARSALRIEPDRERGIRASKLGIEKETGRVFGKRLSRWGINTETVREAVVLASKVAACKGVLAELCVSDDPDYTTGYVASAIFGYMRVPYIKNKGSRNGGRVFFVDEGADITKIVEFLEETPVRAEKSSTVEGERALHEIIRQYHS